MKVLKIVDGIEITKPWNEGMYKHNDVVATEMKENIFTALNDAYKNDDESRLRAIGKNVCAYGFGSSFDMDEMHAEISKELDNVQNYWLNEIYPYMVKDGLVPATSKNFVGYDNK